MTLSLFLSSATPQSTDYILNNTNQKNNADYHKLKKLFDCQLFEARSFSDTRIDIVAFDWKTVEQDRNWWWQLQALPFLNWFTNSFEIQSKEEQLIYFSICLDALQCWIEHAKENKESPLVWHDHAAAYRVRNITNWLLFCQVVNLPLINDTRSTHLASLIIEHLEWLKQDNNYSQYTNHGFDQAMISLTIGLMFSYEGFNEYSQLNRQRLKEELTFAFTDEGVHKENSPGYQKMMLGRLKQLRTLTPLGEKEISELGEKYIINAENFLRAITLPNGYLPMIGDTRGNDSGLPYLQNNDIDILDYTNSGYVIIRGRILDKDIHIVFKACHMSHYHRHDDDLSIHLYFDGKIILADGGLGSHNEKDIERITLRAYSAHNSPYFTDTPAKRNVAELNDLQPTVEINGDFIVGESNCYGYKIRREINLSRISEGVIGIIDSSNHDGHIILASNFYSTLGLFSAGDRLLAPIYPDKSLEIKPKSPTLPEINKSFSSYLFGDYNDINSFSYLCGSAKNKSIEVNVNLQYTPKLLHCIYYRNFGPIEIKETNQWYFDELFPGNVCHHIMSLRWIKDIKNPSIKKEIIKSFISYNQSPYQAKSKFYLGEQADHTTSIRLEILTNLIKEFDDDEELVILIRYELLKNIESCISDTYKKGNNHGLMVDKAVLDSIFTDEAIFSNAQHHIPFLINRVKCQLDSIFDENGFCKEHSISYQEYNLGIAFDLISVMKKSQSRDFYNEVSLLECYFNKIKEASRESLGFALKSDGTYITIGDSFSAPKPFLLNTIFGNKNPTTAFHPESTRSGVFFNKTLGIAVFRNDNMHIAINAAWHSYVHKQNDDLSFFLRFNNEDIFIDGGYSDIIPTSVVDTKSELLHSTIIPKNKSWMNRNAYSRGKSEVNLPEVVGEGIIQFSGEHSRIHDLTLERSVLIEADKNSITIDDNVSINTETLHRFITPATFKITINEDEYVTITSDANIIRIIDRKLNNKRNNCWKLSEITCIKNNEVISCYAIDYISDGSSSLEIVMNKKSR
ncbi:hypothetical protein ES815_12805 [Leclercia adecarboxylata]|uniref:Heparinase II/III-like C-terminal domain-containing protein n=1 Tax=Leclercia adecarboxylata TaxID=83655 RepID=A0AAP9AJR6_9ENTR|nr:heparinase II/III family protein [Leclercia adecarboxylata]QDK19136.1 hypothetical protein ES815_12805 [Leclercia adecarboxylata]